ncbi:MAG: 3,4-dihydroxy-2-butanone-4-phosphate synthase [Bacteroidia bacterium]|nr:3,4-dihydroxy-2-butanone-4-phosphate synthase [Bacteroidia bacterium]
MLYSQEKVKTPPMSFELNTIPEAIEEIKKGKVIIVVDDEDRENEGDFICAAECITPEIVNFMSTHGRGLICTPIEERLADHLNLNLMVSENTALHETAFTVSIDLIGNGCTTGISAHDRSACIKALVNPEIKATDFARPGHIFPLRAKSGGVLRRTGHTEAAIDIAKLAGFSPAGVLVEILNEDGSMARLPHLKEIARKFDLKIISIDDLIAYRMKNERLVFQEKRIPFETEYGSFELKSYREENSAELHIAIVKGQWSENEPILVRVHSSSATGDLISSMFNDTEDKLRQSLLRIHEEGKGAVLIMRQAERVDTFENRLREFESTRDIKSLIGTRNMPQRDFGVGAQILRDMGIRKINLLTNNVKRRIGLIGYGLEIVDTTKIS